MPAVDLSTEEVSDTLAAEHVVRVAFQDDQSTYLIPLGYVWLEGAFYGVMEGGRKSRMAAENPQVAYQVDTSCRTGLFEWTSVTGEGRFEVVSADAERQRALAALQGLIAHAPAWWQREQAPRIASGVLQVWKIVPLHCSGRRYAPPEDGA